ncbi:MAG: hypothetical protein HYT83_03260 [Candidatus Levybacteria bacterium]|nr:hypothetical protein [Candidatus Levybacteria bacterium]
MIKSNAGMLPESPASVTARVVSDKGFHLLFTLRDTTGTGLLAKFEEFEKAVLAKGWKPENSTTTKFTANTPAFQKAEGSKNGSSTAEVSNATCAICQAPALRKSGQRKDGTRWEGVFCSTGEEGHKVWLS